MIRLMAKITYSSCIPFTCADAFCHFCLIKEYDDDDNDKIKILRSDRIRHLLEWYNAEAEMAMWFVRNCNEACY